jgi:hypothetical protein
MMNRRQSVSEKMSVSDERIGFGLVGLSQRPYIVIFIESLSDMAIYTNAIHSDFCMATVIRLRRCYFHRQRQYRDSGIGGGDESLVSVSKYEFLSRRNQSIVS